MSGREPLNPEPPPAAAGGERVPIFGSWPRLYAAVVACALACMLLIGLFSAWRY